MRFLVDAPLPPALARWLVAAGHEAEHVADRGVQAASDGAIWDLALREQFAVVTKAFSKGFFEIAKAMNPPVKRLAIVGADAESALNSVEGALANVKGTNLEVVYNKSYPPATTDYSPIIRAVQASRPDVVCPASIRRTAWGW